jgi:AraC family transcriptional regulator, activator of mtrCDE
MDILGDIISTLELRSTLYFRAELTAPYSISVPEDREVIRFHVANEGPCWIELPTGESARFSAGDLVLVPHGAAHVLANTPKAHPVPLPEVLAESGFDGTGPLVFGGGGARTVIVCGYFAFAHKVMHPVIASLPALIHVKGRAEHHYAWLEQLLAYMEGESKARPEAWGEVIKRVSEILFICVLREYMGNDPHSTGALTALADPHIGKALQAVHADPAADWSIGSLAARAAMSKTVFAERFRETMGLTPARYLASWRMHKARALLDRSRLSIREIAWQTGYTSEAAFNRVFKEHFGVPPGRYRRSVASNQA